jgi:hypothetical protein
LQILQVTIAEMGVYCQAWVAHSHDSQLKKASVHMVAMKHWIHMLFHNNFGFRTTAHNRLLFTWQFFDVINIALLSAHNRIHNRRNIYYIITVRIITLTFKNRASYIYDRRTATLQMLHFRYIFSTNISTEYFKRAAHSPFVSSKCPLFHYATFFGSCIIHILHTVCAKI